MKNIKNANSGVVAAFRGLVLLTALLAGPYAAASAEGSWRVDLERTVWFNSTVLGHSDLAVTLLACSAHHERLRIELVRFTHKVERHYCKYEGKQTEIEGWVSSYDYRVLHEDKKASVLLLESDTGETAVQVLHWVGPDHFWMDQIYDEETGQEMRYFFAREP